MKRIREILRRADENPRLKILIVISTLAVSFLLGTFISYLIYPLLNPTPVFVGIPL